MPEYLGQGSAAGLGDQSVWATAVSRTVWLQLISENMKRDVKWVPREGLAHAGGFGVGSHYKASDFAGGTIEVLAQYEGFGLVWKHALGGTFSTTGPSTGLYTHVMKLGATLPAGLTVEMQRGTGTSELFAGCRVSKATVVCEAAKEMRVSLDLIARTSGGRTTAATPSWTGSRDLVPNHFEAGTLLWDSNTYRLGKLEVMIDNKISTRQELGSALTSEPARTGRTEVRFKADLVWSSDAFDDAFLVGTASDAVITWTATTPAGATLTFAGNRAMVIAVDAPINAVGLIKQTVTFAVQAQADGSDEGLIVTLVNTQANPLAA